MLRFLGRVFRSSFKFHFFVPLIVFLLYETFLIEHTSIRSAPALWSSAQFLAHLTGVYVTFLVVFGWLIFVEGRTHVADITPLEDAVPDMVAYRAFSPTSVREWFDPAAQVYLARLVSTTLRQPAPAHRRVLLFFSQADLEAVKSTLLDGYSATSLMEWHRYFGIPLAFLRPEELKEIRSRLGREERKAIGDCRWLPEPLRSWLLKRRRKLAFAIVESRSAPNSVILFAKSRHALHIRHLREPASVEVYQRVATLIEAKASGPGHDFGNYLG
jgi:hypothetical protein